MEETDITDWPMCTVAGCPNRCCLRLDSDKCYPHTMLGPDADPRLLDVERKPVETFRKALRAAKAALGRV